MAVNSDRTCGNWEQREGGVLRNVGSHWSAAQCGPCHSSILLCGLLFFFSFLNAGTYGHSVRFLLSLILKNLLVMNYFASSAPNWSILETRALLFPQKISCELQSCNQNTHMVSSVGVRKGQRTCLRLVKKSGKS